MVEEWLKKQAIWQIYLPAPRKIPYQIFNIVVPNHIHQADLLYLPHDRVRNKIFKYALTVIDIASRFKAAEPLTSKDSKEIANALSQLYRRTK